jgi:hypothetical protein
MIKEIFTKFIAVSILAAFVLGTAPFAFAQKTNVGKDAQKFIKVNEGRKYTLADLP